MLNRVTAVIQVKLHIMSVNFLNTSVCHFNIFYILLRFEPYSPISISVFFFFLISKQHETLYFCHRYIIIDIVLILVLILSLLLLCVFIPLFFLTNLLFFSSPFSLFPCHNGHSNNSVNYFNRK